MGAVPRGNCPQAPTGETIAHQVAVLSFFAWCNGATVPGLDRPARPAHQAAVLCFWCGSRGAACLCPASLSLARGRRLRAGLPPRIGSEARIRGDLLQIGPAQPGMGSGVGGSRSLVQPSGIRRWRAAALHTVFPGVQGSSSRCARLPPNPRVLTISCRPVPTSSVLRSAPRPVIVWVVWTCTITGSALPRFRRPPGPTPAGVVVSGSLV